VKAAPTKRRAGTPNGRERILEAAYRLFSRYGIRAVGVDAIIAEAGVAKMTLYRNFASKDELVLAFMELREDRWTQNWLQQEVMNRASAPAERLLAIFDVFGEWFVLDDFEGCTFINVLLEYEDREDPVRRASVRHLANIRGFLRDQATAAGANDADELSRQWHILMKGSIVAAAEGDHEAARRARGMGVLLLEHQGVHGASAVPS
jgi:AcrR family transcriptional regulator